MSDLVTHEGPHEGNPVRPPIIERVVRPQDADPKRADSAERKIALMFLLSAVGTVGFIVVVPCDSQPEDDQRRSMVELLARDLAHLSLGGLAAGIIAWVRWLMPAHEVVQERHETGCTRRRTRGCRAGHRGRCRRERHRPSLAAQALARPCSWPVRVARCAVAARPRSAPPQDARYDVVEGELATAERRDRRSRSSSATSRSGRSRRCCRSRPRTCRRRTTRRRPCF